MNQSNFSNHIHVCRVYLFFHANKQEQILTKINLEEKKILERNHHAAIWHQFC